MAKKKALEKPERVKVAPGKGASYLKRNTSTYEEMKKQGLKREGGDDPRVTIYPEKRADPEKGPAPADDIGKGSHYFKKFPPPKKNSAFRRKWAQFIEEIAIRDNFSPGHLFQLEILCDLYAEYEDLNEVILTDGRTYKVMGRQGTLIKVRPEVGRVDKILNQIQSYSKSLHLNISKKAAEGKGKEEEDWS